MGLDITIKHPNGLPLGDVAKVQETLASVFTGLTLKRSSGGQAMLRKVEEQNLKLPDILRANLTDAPPKYEGDYKGANFSVEFYMAISDPLFEVNAVVRGDAGAAQALFAVLEKQCGWITSVPLIRRTAVRLRKAS